MAVDKKILKRMKDINKLVTARRINFSSLLMMGRKALKLKKLWLCKTLNPSFEGFVVVIISILINRFSNCPV